MKNPLILQITSDYPPQPLWGMGWYVNQLRNGLLDKGYRVYIATSNKSKDLHENIITTSKAEDELLLSSNKHEIFNDFEKFNEWQISLADQILKDLNKKPLIIHCHNWMSWLTTQKLRNHLIDVPAAITFHFLQKQYENMKENPVENNHEDIINIERQAIEGSDHIIALSKSQRDLLVDQYGANQKKISIIPFGTNLDDIPYEKIKTAKYKNNTHFDILFVGRVERDKGVEELILGYKSARKEANTRLHIIGDGPILSELSKKYRQEDIIFHGFIPKEKLQEILKKSQVYCLPSLSESLSLSTIEAMYYGVVPIFSKGSTVPTLFKENEEGLTIKIRNKKGKRYIDPDDISIKIQKLIDSPDLLKKLSYKTYQKAHKDYSFSNTIDDITSIYRSLMN